MITRPSMWRNGPFRYLFLMLMLIAGIAGVVAAWIADIPYKPCAYAAGGGVALLSAWLLLRWFLDCLGTRLIVTDELVTIHRGILSKRTSEVRIIDIRNIAVDQSFFQRIFDVGKIDISSAGQAGVELSIAGIARPESIVQEIRDRMRTTPGDTVENE